MNETDYGKATLAFRIIRLLVQWLFRLLFRVRIEGRENLPKGGGYILAGNHLSWLDPFLMLAFAPATPRIYFTGDRHNMTRPAWRRIFTQSVGGVILVERGEHGDKLNEQVREVLQGGGVLGIFPEGNVSETETGQLLPLHKGVGYFAVHSNAPIVPMAFHGTKEPYLGKRLRVIIGSPVPARSGDKEVAAEQTEAVGQAIGAILPPPPHEKAGQIKLLHDFFTYLFMTPAEVAEAKARAREKTASMIN